MLKGPFMNTVSNIFAENRILKFCVVALSVGFCWNTYQLNNFKDRVRTVVVPPVINSKIEISGSWTSDSYVKEYIRYIGSLAWNYSPGIARSQFSELLVSWHPSVFEDAKQRLYIISDQIEQTKAASVFYISKIEHDHVRHIIEVTGTRRLTQQDQQVENGVKTYLVTYMVENGRFWIMGMEEKGADGKPVGAKAPASTPPAAVAPPAK